MNDAPDAVRLNIGMPDGANTPKPPSPPTKQEVIDWLAYQTEALVLRRDLEVLPAIAAMVKAHPRIDDDDEDLQGRFIENIEMAKDLLRDARKAHTEHKAPYLAAGKAVDNWKNAYEAVVDRGLTDIEAISADFALRKYNREKAARDKVAAQAAEAARKAREDAAAITRKNMFSDEAVRATEEAERKARDADKSLRRASNISATSHGDYGAKGSIVRRWKWELRDIKLVPAEHLIVNAATIMIAAKPRDPVTNKPTAVISGIEWVEDVSFGTRG